MAVSRQRQWLYPVVLLSGTAVAAFGLFYTLDRIIFPSSEGSFFSFSPNRIADSIGSLSGMIAAVSVCPVVGSPAHWVKEPVPAREPAEEKWTLECQWNGPLPAAMIA